jgi:hypothetical protein
MVLRNVCGDVGREVIRLTHFQGQSQGQGPYLLLTPYTHGVPHVDCEGPCAVTRTNPIMLRARLSAVFCAVSSSDKCRSLELPRVWLYVKVRGMGVF